MLNSFRSLAGGFSAKILLALLVLSFAVWGIGDMVNSPSHTKAVATVGGTKITRDMFARELSRKSEAMRQMMGDRYSPEMMKSLNLPQQVLSQLIHQALLKRESESLGIVPSDADVARAIRGNRGFHDQKGNFDKNIFDAVLRNMGMSEKNYVEQMRQDMAAALLRETLVASVPVPTAAARALFDVREEQRAVTLYTFGPSLVDSIVQPDIAQLKAYYDAHSREFTAPEYRTVSYVTIAAGDVKENAAAMEDELQAAYKERADEFKHAERRTVEQLLYSSKENAEKAKLLVTGGKSFAAVARETEILNKDAVSLGKVERSKIFEGAADAVFSLKNGGVTDPIQSPFGWHLFHVTAIEPAATASFEEVKPMLEKDLKQRGNDEALNKLANKLEDALAGGNTMAEAAKELGLKVQSAGPFSHTGDAPEGGKAKGVPDFDKFLDTVFKLEEKSDSQLMTAKGSVYYIVHVDKVTPEHLRPLGDVREAAIAGWQKDARETRLADLARTIATKFKTAVGRTGAIATYKLNAASQVTLRRDSQKAGSIALPPQLVMDAFARKAKESTGAYPLANGGYGIAVIENVIQAPSSDKDAKTKEALAEVQTNLESTARNEMIDQYSRYLMEKYNVTVDQAMLQSVVAP